MEEMSDIEGVFPFFFCVCVALNALIIIITTKTTNIINTNVADVAVRLLLCHESLIEYKPWNRVAIYASLKCKKIHIQWLLTVVRVTAMNKYVQISFSVTVCNCSC